jgi:hypothetical protein
MLKINESLTLNFRRAIRKIVKKKSIYFLIELTKTKPRFIFIVNKLTLGHMVLSALTRTKIIYFKNSKVRILNLLNANLFFATSKNFTSILDEALSEEKSKIHYLYFQIYFEGPLGLDITPAQLVKTITSNSAIDLKKFILLFPLKDLKIIGNTFYFEEISIDFLHSICKDNDLVGSVLFRKLMISKESTQ